MAYSLPAEWHPQSGIMLTWPQKKSYWSPILTQTEKFYAALIQEISVDERVLLVCDDVEKVQNFLKPHLTHMKNVIFCEVPSNDVWVRDYGPITVFSEGKPLLLNFTFNAWGNKYVMPLDNSVTQNLHEKKVFGDTELHSIDFVLEGGSIETDGLGTLLTTRRCLLKKNRNEKSTETTITETLKKYFGIQQILWLSEGQLPGDDTDAHIDTLARFCDPHTILYQGCSDPQDDFYSTLKSMENELMQFKQLTGKPYRFVELPGISPKMSRFTHERLPASYANFLITNSKVLVPTYDDPSDGKALNIFSECFPNRKVIGINSLLLIENFGSLHCISMQLPEGVLS